VARGGGGGGGGRGLCASKKCNYFDAITEVWVRAEIHLGGTEKVEEKVLAPSLLWKS